MILDDAHADDDLAAVYLFLALVDDDVVAGRDDDAGGYHGRCHSV